VRLDPPEQLAALGDPVAGVQALGRVQPIGILKINFFALVVPVAVGILDVSAELELNPALAQDETTLDL